MKMPWDTLHEAVRCAVGHRHDWPLPIAIVADWEETGRTPGPARYSARPAGSDDTHAAVFSLGLDELLTLAPLLDDFLELDRALESLLHGSSGAVEAEQEPGSLHPASLIDAVESLAPGA